MSNIIHLTCDKCERPMTSPINQTRASLNLTTCIECASLEDPKRTPASIHLDHDGNPITIPYHSKKTLPEI